VVVGNRSWLCECVSAHNKYEEKVLRVGVGKHVGVCKGVDEEMLCAWRCRVVWCVRNSLLTVMLWWAGVPSVPWQ
jgi:hypothetical protein